MNIIHVHNLDFNFKFKTSKQIYQKILFTFQLSFYIQFYTINFTWRMFFLLHWQHLTYVFQKIHDTIISIIWEN